MSRLVAEGAMIALPWNTVRIELSNVSGSVSLSRKPEAPAVMAAITYSSKSNVVRMITRVGRSSADSAETVASAAGLAESAALPGAAESEVIRLVASMPSMPGMRTSISTTSGCRDSANATAWAPSDACPTTSISGCEPMTMAKPARTSSWSSAIITRMLLLSFMLSTVSVSYRSAAP